MTRSPPARAANPWVWVVEFKSLTVPAPSKP